MERCVEIFQFNCPEKATQYRCVVAGMECRVQWPILVYSIPSPIAASKNSAPSYWLDSALVNSSKTAEAALRTVWRLPWDCTEAWLAQPWLSDSRSARQHCTSSRGPRIHLGRWVQRSMMRWPWIEQKIGPTQPLRWLLSRASSSTRCVGLKQARRSQRCDTWCAGLTPFAAT